MLFADANRGNVASFSWFPDPWITFAPDVILPFAVTMRDVLLGTNNVIPRHAQLDKPRHRGRVNVVFADGHVATIPLTAAALQRVYLTIK